MTTMRDEPEDLACRALTHGRLWTTRELPPQVLFVHGGFHGAWCWRSTLTFMAAHGVGGAAVDLRGHGGLTQDSSFKEQGVAAMCGDVVEAARLLPERIVLAGHSLGALIALSSVPHIDPRGLILLAPAAPGDVSVGHALPLFPPDRLVQPPGEARARKWFMSGATSENIGDYLNALCAESPKLLNECFHDGVSIDAKEITCPVLCLSGARDDSPLHARGQDETVARHFGATLRTIPSSGHCLMLDDGWRETAQAVMAWVSAPGVCVT